MRLVHEPADGEATVLARQVAVADTFLAQLRGLMFRRSIPEDYALVFPFDRSRSRGVHMLFVFQPIDVVWTDGEEVTRVATLSAWTGLGRARGDRFVELPAGAADRVEPGDVVRIVEE